jgi:hypothetical protein
MPHITTAMHRSVRRGVGDIVFDSLHGRKRQLSSITGEVSSVKNSFSSWSNCMKASYCKFVTLQSSYTLSVFTNSYHRWPVIIAIVVVSLIVFSVLWCIIRCACCGMSCCCTCFSFLKCCDCCGGCCDGKKDRPHKHLDDPYSHPPQQGYQAPSPMMGGGLGGKYEPPQYAQFEVGKNGLAVDPKASALSEDALPPMPSWDSAAKKHVLTEEEKNGVELGELDPVTGQKVPLMTGAAATGVSLPPSPVNELGASPYGARPGQGVGGNGYTGVPGDPYSRNQNAFNQNGRGYGGSPPPGTSGPGRGYGPSSPQDIGGPGGRGYGPPSPQDPYGNSNNGFVSATVGGVGGYGRTQPQRQYSGDTNNSGRPYSPQPTRQYSSDSSRPLNPGRQYSDRPYPGDNFQPQGPPRGPSRGPGGPGRMASPPLNNNSGFDFGTGAQQSYPSSRPSPPPQQQSYGPSNNGRRASPPSQQGDAYSTYSGSTAPPTYASRSPPPQEASYPGYQPYQAPSNQGGSGAPRVLMSGGGRGGREPQGWDPVQR